MVRHAGAALVMVLLAPALAATGASGAPRLPEHGVTVLHEAHEVGPDLPGLDVPEVVAGGLVIFWRDVEPREGEYDWSAIDRDLELWRSRGKKLDIVLASAHDGPSHTPAWLFREHGVRRIGKGAWCDFEAGLPDGYTLGDVGRISADGALSGAAGLCSSGDSGLLLRYGGQGRLARAGEYSLQFEHRAEGKDATLRVELRTASGGPQHSIARSVPVRPGEWETFTLETKLGDFGDYEILWHAEGEVAVDNINCISIEEAVALESSGFEGGDPGVWSLGPGASLMRDPAQAFSGEGCVTGRADGAEGERVPLLQTNPDLLPIRLLEGYNISARYRALEDCQVYYRIYSYDRAPHLVHEKVVDAKAADGWRLFDGFSGMVWLEGAVAEYGIIGSGAVLFDEVLHIEYTRKTACLPDYFDPAFRTRWERLVHAFAERYGDDPALGTVAVGGFGRWEEVMLYDDLPGRLDAQWYARGYSKERYLEQLCWAMDLYRRELGSHPLRVLLSPGLNPSEVAEAEWTFRHSAQEAARRGIGFRQNGMSERYDTFNPMTAASFTYRRYAGPASELPLAHETGGQMYNNGYGLMGHPISLLGRTLVSGAQIANLYTVDVRNPSIGRYLPFFHGQAGRMVTTGYFCRLGEFALRNYQPQTRAFADVEYRNLWMGLRQFQSSDQACFRDGRAVFAPDYAMAEYTQVDGEPCAATGGESRMLLFDVFDAHQAEGMYGAVASIEYLDDEGAFAALVTDGGEGWREAARVRKQGTGRWRTLSFQDPAWLRSAKDHGEMHYNDLAIRDEGSPGGRTYVRSVELQFILATDWASRAVGGVERSPDASGPLLGGKWTEARAPLLDEPVHAVALPVRATEYGRQLVEAEVWHATDRGRRLLARRERFMPAREPEDILLALPPTTGGVLELRLRCAEGAVVWLAGEDGTLAHRLLIYDLSPGKPDSARSGEFDALRPFAGLVLPPGAGAVKLERYLPGTGWSEPITTVAGSVGRQATAFCEPQTAGRYRLTRGATTSPVIPAALLELERALPAYEAAAVEEGEVVTEWHGRTSWQPLEGLRRKGPGVYRLTGPYPALVPRSAVGHKPSQSDQIVIAIRNGTGSSLMRLWWADPEGSFAPGRSVYIPIVANDTELREYAFHLGCEPLWAELPEIGQLRLEPVTGATDRGEIEVGRIALVREPDVAGHGG